MTFSFLKICISVSFPILKILAYPFAFISESAVLSESVCVSDLGEVSGDAHTTTLDLLALCKPQCWPEQEHRAGLVVGYVGTAKHWQKSETPEFTCLIKIICVQRSE